MNQRGSPAGPQYPQSILIAAAGSKRAVPSTLAEIQGVFPLAWSLQEQSMGLHRATSADVAWKKPLELFLWLVVALLQMVDGWMVGGWMDGGRMDGSLKSRV